MNCKTLRIRLSKPLRESDEAAANCFLESVEISNIVTSLTEQPEPQWAVLVFFEPRGGKPETAPREEVVVGDEEKDLFEALKAWRFDRARTANVPVYVIARNRTLAEIARLRPSTGEELGEVKGFGPTRLEKYGAGVLAVIAELERIP